MIDIPVAPYNCDFITDFADNIYNYIHDAYYKTNKEMYQKYNTRLEECIKICNFGQRKSALCSLRKELCDMAN